PDHLSPLPGVPLPESSTSACGRPQPRPMQTPRRARRRQRSPPGSVRRVPTACGLPTGSVAPGADVRIVRHREREGERVARPRRTRAEPVLLRGLQLEARLEDAVPVRANEPDRLPWAALAVAALHGHDLLVARRHATPDADLPLVEIGDKGEP